ncbi:MAG: HAMP domain-containing histidine kinase [Deltaproteobacteria bacterium]|nr:HAMP domain-containing histidine kinase [Deltaproteobacteria bacterium]
MSDLVDPEEARTEFLAMLVHELRNPLSTAHIAVDLITESATDEMQMPASMLASSLGRLGTILRGVAHNVAVARGPEQPTAEDVDLHAFVSEVSEGLRAAAAGRAQTLTVSGESTVVSIVSSRLVHTVTALLSAALRFSAEGSSIEARVAGTDSGARVEIDDVGPGITDAEASALFSPFDTARSPAPEDRPTGLAMHVARRMVERHRGTIGVRNRSDLRGVTYWFELPR